MSHPLLPVADEHMPQCLTDILLNEKDVVFLDGRRNIIYCTHYYNAEGLILHPLLKENINVKITIV